MNIQIQKQDRLREFVNREVIMQASQLVDNLLKASRYGDYNFGGIEFDSIENLHITDEATARDGGYTSLEEMQDAGEDVQEIYEWWFVSKWLYIRLSAQGEPVIDSDYGYLWGRTCTGQAIFLDSVIEKIYDDLTRL